MANSEFIEIISEQTKAQIDAIMPMVRELAKSIKDINSFTASNTPSGADKNINAVNDAYKKRSENIAKVRAELEKTTALQKQIENSAKNQTSSVQKLTKAELDYVSAVERGLKAKEREVLATKKLNDAYGQLTTKRNEVSRALQNSIVLTGKSSTETKKLQKEFDVLNKKVGEADKAIGKFSQANNGFQKLASGVTNLMGAFGISTGLYLGAELIGNIYSTTKALQSLDLALKMVSGSQEEFISNQTFLKGLAEQYGIEIKGLTKNFTEFWVASKGKLEAQQIKEIFTSISKSVAVMGLSVEQQDSAFLALQQMMSKGTVQAEELKKQLGNALPGAVKAATMAYQALHPEMKVTEKLFMEHMKAGKVLSSELLPELAKAYEKLYGIENVKRAETLQAAQERLANSWTELVRGMNTSSTSGIGKWFTFMLNGLTAITKELDRFLNSWENIDKKAHDIGIGKGKESFATNIAKARTREEAMAIVKLNQQISREAISTKEAELKSVEDRLKELDEVNLKNLSKASIGVLKIQERAAHKRREELLNELGFAQGTLKAANQYNYDIIQGNKAKNDALRAQNKNLTEETEKERKAREKAEKEREKALLKSMHVESVLSGKLELSKAEDTALERLKQLKQALETTRDETAKNTVEFQEFEKSIEDVNKAIEVITKPLKTDVSKELDAWQKNYNQNQKAIHDEKKRQFEDAVRAFNTFVGDFANKSGFGESFDLFLRLDEDGKTMFDNLLEAGEKTGEEYKAIFLGITTAAQDAFNLISEMSNRRFEEQYARLEKEKEVALKFAGESDSAKQKIEDDYEKRRKEVAKREFKAKQQQAMVNIAIDTAQAIMMTYGQMGWIGGTAGAVFLAALGVAQMGLVAAQKPPEYWTGTDNAEAGLAWTQERGAEIITDKKGNIKDFGDNKGARLTMMEKGDKVYTASETKQMMFNKELNSLMLDNGINMPKVVVNNSGLSKSDMREVMIETLGSQPQYHSGFDGSGFYRYMSKNGNITRRLEDRGNGSGLTF